MNKLFAWAKKKAADKTILGAAIVLGYQISLCTWLTSIIILAITSIWIPIAALKLPDNFKFADLAKQFWFPLLICLTILLCTSLATEYKKTKSKESVPLRESYKMIQGILVAWHDRLNTLNDRASECTKRREIQSLLKDHMYYNHRASYFCGVLYNGIADAFQINDHQVSIMHKGKDYKGSYIKMIAYKTSELSPPGSFDTKYYFENELEKDYFHVEQFKKNKRGIKVLIGKKAISDIFVPNPKSEERESELQQFIAIPIVDEKKEVVSLIQIDSKTENAFGANVDEIRRKIEINLNPAARILALWLKEEEIFRETLKCN